MDCLISRVDTIEPRVYAKGNMKLMRREAMAKERQLVQQYELFFVHATVEFMQGDV